ncbi:arylsulfatase B-like [Sycon ciliatum]|uniref:arylsulfatase B-like n=1 Tax=Sycon ciliatum TaxID=27933 RepID=UPI0031F6DC98|eukprot:scpid93434/ scgid11087/ Arylsulfatase B; N-acetylgalactosamine-4-sulfatase
MRLWLALLLAFSGQCLADEILVEPAAGTKPHIVMILVDDWGWANVGYHRDPPTKEVQTPNFDSLCKEGIELDQHYAYKFCSPSRSSLMSGRLPIHVNILNDPPNVYNPNDTVSGYAAIPRNMTGMAAKLKAAGYATHQVGKWDAGMATPDHTPVGRGFDTSFGYFHHANDYWTEQAGGCKKNKKHLNVTDLWMTSGPADGINGTDYEEALFKKHVLQVISSHPADTPLFLYYAPHIAHTPLQVPQDYLDRYAFIDTVDRRIYHAMVAYLDDVIGNLTAALKDRDLWDNTLIVVSSDNGGPVYPGGGANNYPLRGGKVTNWQGGVRVNAFVSGGFLPSGMRGQKLDGYVALADWYATFCSLAGVDKTDQRAKEAGLPPVDGLDMWPMLSGQNTTSPRTEIPLSPGLISGDYKILVGNNDQAGWTGPQYPNQTNPKGGISSNVQCGSDGCLYNIKTDPEERNNLAAGSPDILAHMQARLKAWESTAFNPDRGQQWAGACEVALDKYGGYWGPFLP